jgi:TrmH family RNA methyltransferase
MVRRRRRLEPMILVEGHRQLRRSLEAGARVRELYSAPELFLGDADPALVALAERGGARVYEVSASAFASISTSARADGLVAVVERPATTLARLRLPEQPLIVVADGVERPGNLGAIARSACAAGADALFVCDARTDPFHPDAVRGSVGTVFGLRVVETTSETAVAWMREHGLRVIVATPSGRRAHWDADVSGAVALVLGGERHGVSTRWLEEAHETVRIPMPGAGDSLNVAVAAGVVLFDAVRRRSAC